jgi:hypothetical protein
MRLVLTIPAAVLLMTFGAVLMLIGARTDDG